MAQQKSTEATTVAFTEIVTPSGIVWHATFREGATMDSAADFMHMLDKTGMLLTRHGFTFTERKRVTSDIEAKKKLAEIMKGHDWPIDNESFLNKMLTHAQENLGLDPDTMRADFDLWVRFIRNWDASGLIEVCKDGPFGPLDDEYAGVPTLDEVEPIELGGAAVPGKEMLEELDDLAHEKLHGVTIEGAKVKNGDYDANYVASETIEACPWCSVGIKTDHVERALQGKNDGGFQCPSCQKWIAALWTIDDRVVLTQQVD